MRLATVSKFAAITGIAGSVVLGMATIPAEAQKVRLKMHSDFPSSLTQLGTLGKRFVDNVNEMSGGTLKIKFFEPGALVPGLQGFDPVSEGSIDAAWGAAGYHVGKIPAAAWFTAVPFGPRASVYMAWMRFGGGLELWREVYEPFGITPYPCGVLAPEASGWFRKPITSLDQLKGMKMRFFGLGALVMEKMGVSTQLLAAADIYPALERGTIDATEFSMPAIDLKLGFYQVAKHYYFPGWHQQSSILEFIINTQKLNSLSKAQQKILEIACGESVLQGLAEGEAIQFGALKELKAKGVQIHRWSPEILAAFRKGWDEVLEEKSQEDALFRKVRNSLEKFRADYKIWKDIAFVD